VGAAPAHEGVTSSNRVAPAAIAVALFAAVTALGALLYRGALAPPVFPTTLASRALAPLCRGLAAATAGALHLAGVSVTRDGAILRHPGGFAIEVTPNCTGWFHAVLFLAGLALLRSGRRPQRAPMHLCRQAVAGVGVLAAMNLARLVLLYLAGGVSPRAFEWSHHFAGEALLAGTVLLLWWRAGAPRSAGEPFASSEIRSYS
jgi:exosortase/archaeosortase family protein